MSELHFDNRIAIVTGAGGNPGLGRSYALLLAARGAKVLVNDYGVGPDGRGAIGGGPGAVVREIQDAGGTALANKESVASRDGAARIVQCAMDAWGQVDIVINNAGIAPFAMFDEISDSDIERVVGVHLMGTIWLCRAAWPHMKARGYGRIVNVTSTVGLLGGTHQSIYSGAKLGILGFTRAIATEGAPLGIRANVVSPAADTLAWQTMLEPAFSAQAQQLGLLPEVVAPVTAWLAHESCPLTGRVVGTGGGALHEIFISRTRDTSLDPKLKLEDVPDRFAQCARRAGALEYDKAIGDHETTPNYVPKPYTTVRRVSPQSDSAS